MKQPPSQLAQDNRGNWYFLPETELVRFETTLWFSAAHPEEPIAKRAEERFLKYRIDDPSCIRVLAWEEIT